MKQFMSFTKKKRDLVGGHCKQCDIVKNLNKQQRWETVKNHELCFSCLEEGHKVAE